MNMTDELRQGFETAFIDANITSNLAYKPQFVSNNYKEGKKVLASIEEELLACDCFQISVAFIGKHISENYALLYTEVMARHDSNTRQA